MNSNSVPYQHSFINFRRPKDVVETKECPRRIYSNPHCLRNSARHIRRQQEKVVMHTFVYHDHIDTTSLKLVHDID